MSMRDVGAARREDGVQTIILFDADCVLCSAWVRFLLRHERAPRSRFVSAWSEEGRRLAQAHGLTVADLDETFLVIRNEVALTRSDAALALTEELRAPVRWLGVGWWIPRALRDWLYDRIARNRYRWFGRKEMCVAPPPEQRHRFVLGAAGDRATAKAAE
ncbi:MAG: DCC1-like thiol-disulfide oxidoreductase family protein [Pseudomonadota bacterium]